MSTQTLATIGARLDRLPMSKWHYRILWLMGLGLFVDGFDVYLGGVVLAALVKQGWSNNELNGIFISVTMAGLFVGSLMGGYLGDRFGRRRAYLINPLIFGLTSIASVFATDMMTLIVLRGIMAVGMGAEIVADFGSFPEYLPTATRGKYASISAMIGNFSPPAAALVAFILIPIFSWRAMFLVVGVATLILWYARLKTLPESPRWLASQGFVDKADEALTKLEKQIEAEKGITLPQIEQVEAPPRIKQVPLTALFKGQLLRRTIAISCGLIGLNTALYTIVNWIPTIFVNAGVTVSKSFAMTTIMLCGAPLGVYLISLIADNLPRRTFAPVLLVGIGLFGYVYSLQRDPAMIVGFGFLMTVIIYMYVGLMNAVYVPEMFPTEARLRGIGFCSALGRLVSVFTPPVVAWILTNYGPVTVFQTVLATLGFLAVGLAFFGVETRKKSLEEINKNVI